jgi:hypothetical protein
MARCATVLVFVSILSVIALLSGCTGNPNPAAQSSNKHGEHAHAPAGDGSAAASLVLSTTPERPRTGEPVELRMMLHDSAGQMLTKFEPNHEKLAHLIIVRDGLDEFAHLHPSVDAAGNITGTHTFPVGGTYHVFLDYKAAGSSPATSQAKLVVEGDAPTAPPLTPNVPGTLQGDGLGAEVSMRSSSDKAQIVTFRVQDANGKDVPDLERYLGAMGHIVVLSADGTKYVHAHPLTEQASPGTVEFEVHFPEPGTYKAWGQFQRGGKVFTIPAVIAVEAGSHQH